MSYGSPDVYYQPEHFGLRIIGEINDPNACYSFDDLVVWLHEASGVVYYATDGGCSCPSPFENFTSLNDLTIVAPDTWDEFSKAVIEHSLPYRSDESDPQAVDKVELLAKVSKLVL